MRRSSLYRLMTWLSPAFPVGSFTHSGGLEWAIAEGLIPGRAELQSWIEDLFASGSARSDAVLFAHAWRSGAAGDGKSALCINELAAALTPSRERRLEATAQGAAFRRIARTAAMCPARDLLAAISDEHLNYPVVVAVLAAGHDIGLADALTAYLHALAGNMVSAAQRLIPMGQTDAQIAMASLEATVTGLVDWAIALPEGDPFDHLGSGTLMADFATLAHETQYTRIFRT